MNIATSIDQLIGNTPLMRLTRLEQKLGLQGQLLAKLEYFNPGGSIKDRAALQMLRAAEQAGRIGPGALIIEPTSGNTGIGLCMLCAARGYRAIIVVPETASIERIKLMRAYGAQVVLTPGSAGMRGAVERAEALARENENAFIPSQFDNPENANAHYLTTGPEIWAQTEGHVDALVAGVGTGGTITGKSPEDSVVNSYLQHWDAENLFVVGAGNFPHNGGCNPTGTVGALGYRCAEGILKYSKKGGSLV